MTRHTHSKLLPLIAAGCMLAIAGQLLAAERGGPPGGMRQEPLDRGAANRSLRVPGKPPETTGIPASRNATRLPVPEDRSPLGMSITHRGTRYLVSGGQWYEQRGRDLVAAPPPAGVMVRDLPDGYSMRWIGGVPYFYADGLYYIWRERPRRYEIMQSPPPAEQDARLRESAPAAAAPEAQRESAPTP
jgi:hypothetical protein